MQHAALAYSTDSCKMSSATLLLFFAAACSSLLLVSSRKMDTNREALIQSAIAEVKHEFSTVQKVTLTKAQAKLHAFKKASPQSMAQGLASLKFERMVKVAEKKILRSRRLASVQTTSSMAEALATELLHKPGSILSTQEIARIYQESNCGETIQTPINCDTPEVTTHRTPDGSCNNIANPTLGAAGTPLRRFISARYDDGISRPRGYLQSQGSPLFNGVFSAPTPSARVASIAIVKDREDNDTTHTHMMMQWGQFMDHDLDEVPAHNLPCSCIDEDGDEEGSCYPFRIPEDDTEISVTQAADNVGCFIFRRSLGVCSELGSELKPREQLNEITHFVDGSMVYGHTTEFVNNQLRDLNSDAGQLRTGPPATEGGSRPLLPEPTAEPGGFVICPPGTDPACFLAGDIRVNEQSALTVMHTIWVREHNRIAQSIRDNNPSLTSDEIYLITREIVSSEIQKITYQDFLPILIGDSFSSLIPPYVGEDGYDPSVDPSIPNAFAAAAYRYGHSQIQPFFERLDEDLQSIPAGPLALVDAFFDTSHVRQFGTDAIVRGLVAKPARAVDEFLNIILTSRLFADDADTPGLDLASLNIQRGRDHGLPTYLTWKQWAEERCGVESDFRHELTEIHLLQTYGSLESVDLFVGGLAEEPLPGGLVGAVFGCIIAKTFEALRDGDRFYYENSNSETGLFTPAQIEQLNLATLSRVLCDNTDITQIQPNAFLAEPRVACSNLPSVDLTLWTGDDCGGGTKVEKMSESDMVSASSKEDKLVGLMEEMIKELKSAKASSHKESAKQEKKEMETSEVASDSTLVSELEKVLQELE